MEYFVEQCFCFVFLTLLVQYEFIFSFIVEAILNKQMV